MTGKRAKDGDMSTLLTPSVDDLTAERERILSDLHMPEGELRARAEDFLLTTGEARALRRLGEIDFLLGDD
jgi:hypothetical protein